LELVANSPVEDETLAQRVMPADESSAGELEIWTRQPVNLRVALLQKSNSQEALIYGVSSTFFSGGMRDLDMT
jgi:chorismate-pyruvate lyase